MEISSREDMRILNRHLIRYKSDSRKEAEAHKGGSTMDKKYIVKRKIDLYEFSKAHKTEYGWENMEDSCVSFRRDIQAWTTYFTCTWDHPVGGECDLCTDKTFSSEFLPHLVKYGFIEEVKEEKIYARGDLFLRVGTSDRYYMLDGSRNFMKLVGLTGIDRGYSWRVGVEVSDSKAVTQEEIDRMYNNGEFRKVEGEIRVVENGGD